MSSVDGSRIARSKLTRWHWSPFVAVFLFRSGLNVCFISGVKCLLYFRGKEDMADVHREAAMRLVACLTMCLMPILANTAQTDAQAPSDPQAYCVNHSADFYPYTGEPCKSGYQLGPGNCRKADGRMVAVAKEQCVAMGGLVALPFEGGRPPPKFMK